MGISKIRVPAKNRGMDVYETRRRNLQNLVKTRFSNSQADLADAVGIKPPQVNRWLSKTTSDPRKISERSARQIETALNISPGWLDKNHQNVATGPEIQGYVPLISTASAGDWSEAIDPHEPGYAEDWMPCPRKHGSNTYALRVSGDSMTAPYGKSYPNGCIIFVDPDKREPQSGDRIIAKLKDSNEVTFKAFQRDAGRTWLKPLNPQHPPVMDEFVVLGTIIGKWEED